MISVGGLFAGIAGLERALAIAGGEPAWFCEADDYCCRVLARHYPGVPIIRDAALIPEEIDAGRIARPAVLAGGFPCQPVSQAGARRAQSDERWLWPLFAAAIAAIKPRLVIVENVPGLLYPRPVRDADTGRVVLGADGSAVVQPAPIGEVLGDLAALGFDAEWGVRSARDAGAPHIRERVWLLAWPAQGGVPDARSG